MIELEPFFYVVSFLFGFLHTLELVRQCDPTKVAIEYSQLDVLLDATVETSIMIAMFYLHLLAICIPAFGLVIIAHVLRQAINICDQFWPTDDSVVPQVCAVSDEDDFEEMEEVHAEDLIMNDDPTLLMAMLNR